MHMHGMHTRMHMHMHIHIHIHIHAHPRIHVHARRTRAALSVQSCYFFLCRNPLDKTTCCLCPTCKTTCYFCLPACFLASPSLLRCWQAGQDACSKTGGDVKRVLEYGVRAPVLYGHLREKWFSTKPTGSLFCSRRNLRKPPG